MDTRYHEKILEKEGEHCEKPVGISFSETPILHRGKLQAAKWPPITLGKSAHVFTRIVTQSWQRGTRRERSNIPGLYVPR